MHFDINIIKITIDDIYSKTESKFQKEVAELNSSSKMIRFNNDFGRWIRNNYGFWTSSFLKDHFIKNNIIHPDDMSWFIMVAYWQKIHNIPIDLDEEFIQHNEKMIKDIL